VLRELDGTSFADIVANLLGVFILLAMLALVLKASHSELAAERAVQPARTVLFQVPPRQALRPFIDFYLVDRDGVVRFDLEPLSEVAADPKAAAAGSLEPTGLKYVLAARRDLVDYALPAAQLFRDMNEYNLLFDIDTAGRPVWTDVETLLSELGSQRRDRPAHQPLFYVRASGFDIFVTLHHRLTEEGVRFRWVAFEDGQQLRLYRDPSMFGRYDYRG
jgi:hypothetical protein